MHKELWLECVDWLVSAGILDPTTNFAKPADFAAILRDGVLLCELAAKLSPGCIDHQGIFMQYQQSPFICSKNIALFLDVCRGHFGITDLFKENDLYALQDFAAVLRVLSLLSHSQHSKALGLRPFPELATPSNESLREENEIYCNLREEIEHSSAVPIPDHHTYQTEDSRKREELYDTILTQRVPKHKSAPTKYTEFKPTSKREFCLKELLDTEMNFCDALAMIIETFYDRLKFKLNSADFATIFINVKEILQVHKNFLSKLSPAVYASLRIEELNIEKTGGEGLQVAEVFLRFKMDFVVYAQYCSLLKTSHSRIEELERTQPDMKRFFSADSNTRSSSPHLGGSSAPQNFNLRDLLVLPMQRILKYSLLLNNLMESTQEIVEQAMLGDAVEAMKDVGDFINEVKRDHEAIEVISTVQRSVSSLKLSHSFADYGRLMQDGAVKLVDHDEGSGRLKQRYVFVFEKLMMVCKQTKGGLYEFRHAHLLSNYELVENEQDFPSINRNNTLSRKLTNSFFDSDFPVIITRRGYKVPSEQSANSVQITLKSEQQRDTWKSVLRDAIDINNPRAAIARGHSLLYKTYICATVCSICQKLLGGKFFQGFHCSGCNRDMHRNCCARKDCIGKNAGTVGRNGRQRTTNVIGYQPGELVVCRETISSPDHSRLSCQSGDLIEIVDVNDDGTAVGRLNAQPERVGLVPLDCLVRTSVTLETMRRRSRSSANSISEHQMNNGNGVIPLMKPTDSPNQPNRPLSLVSLTIIKLSEAEELDLADQPWYFGTLSRDEANQLLTNTDDGTFIVRLSEQQQLHVLSVRFEGVAKHMKIQSSEDGRYFLHDAIYFDSIPELITFFRENPLKEAFCNLETTLRGTPLKGHVYRAIHPFRGKDSAKYLSLNRGDIVRVLDTTGEQNGWWKGTVNNERFGFFPITYVERVLDPEDMDTQNNDRGSQYYHNQSTVVVDQLQQQQQLQMVNPMNLPLSPPVLPFSLPPGNTAALQWRQLLTTAVDERNGNTPTTLPNRFSYNSSNNGGNNGNNVSFESTL